MIVVRKDPPKTAETLVVNLDQEELQALHLERNKLSAHYEGDCSSQYPTLWRLTYSILEKAQWDKK